MMECQTFNWSIFRWTSPDPQLSPQNTFYTLILSYPFVVAPLSPIYTDRQLRIEMPEHGTHNTRETTTTTFGRPLPEHRPVNGLWRGRRYANRQQRSRGRVDTCGFRMMYTKMLGKLNELTWWWMKWNGYNTDWLWKWWRFWLQRLQFHRWWLQVLEPNDIEKWL